jgi:serine/threonine protein kinase
MIGQVIQNYRIVSNIGEGGMGNIYLASHISLERSAAIKQLHSDLTNNVDFKQRFINEAKILAQLNHPNIITVYDLIEERGNYFIIMEFVKGDTIDKIIEKMRSPFHPARALSIFIQILGAFDYAHSKGIVHRDIKPSNIILDENDVPKVLDFGIAKILQKDYNLTKAGTKMGSLLYMSPEQVLGKDVDLRSDIFSLGVLLYEMLTASLPYNTNSEYEIMDSILKQPVPDLNLTFTTIPKNLGNIIIKACDKNPFQRFQSAGEFKQAIEESGFKEVSSNSTFSKTTTKYDRTVIENAPTGFVENYPIAKKKSNTNLLIIFSVVIILIGAAIFFYILSDSGNSDLKIVNQGANKNDNLDQKNEANNRSNEQEKEEARNTFIKWINCWQNKDLECYKSYMSSDYSYESSTGSNKYQYYDERLSVLRKQFSERKYINITYLNLNVTLIDNSQARLTYNQEYKSDQYNDAGYKVVYLKKENNVWKIFKDTYHE